MDYYQSIMLETTMSKISTQDSLSPSSLNGQVNEKMVDNPKARIKAPKRIGAGATVKNHDFVRAEKRVRKSLILIFKYLEGI